MGDFEGEPETEGQHSRELSECRESLDTLTLGDDYGDAADSDIQGQGAGALTDTLSAPPPMGNCTPPTLAACQSCTMRLRRECGWGGTSASMAVIGSMDDGEPLTNNVVNISTEEIKR